MPSRRWGQVSLIPEEPEVEPTVPHDTDAHPNPSIIPINDTIHAKYSLDSTSSICSSLDGSSLPEPRSARGVLSFPLDDQSRQQHSTRGILKTLTQTPSQGTRPLRRLSMSTLQVPSTPESDEESSVFLSSKPAFFAHRNSLHDTKLGLTSPPYSRLHIRESELSFSPYGFHTDTGCSHPRRRLRRNSSSRLSTDLEDDAHEAVTLLSFAHSAQALYSRLRHSCHRVFRRIFFKPKFHATKVVCEAEIMEQTTLICKDYVLNHLTTKELLSGKVGVVAPHWPGSDDVIMAGSVLENCYPRTYSNLCRKLSVTLSSAKAVRTYFNSFLGVLFEGNRITWAKIVSMFAVAGLFAEECCSQGHPEFVPVVVDTVADFTATSLLKWLVVQGGWDFFPTSDLHGSARVSKFGILLVAGAVTLVVVSRHIPMAAIMYYE